MEKASAGFSFVELIVAATILGMVFFAVTSTLPTTVKSFRVEQEVATDTIDARNIVEIVRATGFSSLRDMCVSLATFDVVKETLSCTLHAQLTPQARLLASGSEASPTVQFHFWKANESGQLSGIASKDELVGFGGSTFADFVVRIPGNNGVETTLASSIAQFDGMDEAYNIGVSGFVRNERGEPIPHPQIEFTSHDTGKRYRPQTGQDGYYHFPTGIPTGEYRVFIEKEHHQDILHVGIPFDKTTEQNYILRRLYTLRGRVTDERAGTFGGSYPVSGATVSVSGGPSVQTDSDGYYEIKGLLAGPNGDPQNYSITVSKDGGWVSKAEGVAIGSKPHPYHQLDFILDYRIRVSGVVRDHNGNAVGDATVTLSPGGKSATTASNGTFAINDVVPGIYSVTASKNAYDLHRLNDVRIENNPHTLTFTLDGRANLTGRVSGHNNATLSGVSVVLYKGSRIVASTTTSGSFGFNKLEPASDYRLVVQKPGFTSREMSDISVSYPDAAVGTITLLPNVVLNAKDATTGSDVSNLKVMLGSTKSTSTSGATHTFEAVVPGTYTLDIQDNRSTPAYYQTDKPSRESIAVSATAGVSKNVNVYPYQTITGTVVDSDTNTPIQNVEVTLYEDGVVRNTTLTDPSGKYTFVQIRHDREYLVQFEHPDYDFGDKVPLPPSGRTVGAPPKKKKTVVFIDGQRYESDDRIIRDAIPGVHIEAVRVGTDRLWSVSRIPVDTLTATFSSEIPRGQTFEGEEFLLEEGEEIVGISYTAGYRFAPGGEYEEANVQACLRRVQGSLNIDFCSPHHDYGSGVTKVNKPGIGPLRPKHKLYLKGLVLPSYSSEGKIIGHNQINGSVTVYKATDTHNEVSRPYVANNNEVDPWFSPTRISQIMYARVVDQAKLMPFDVEIEVAQLSESETLVLYDNGVEHFHFRLVSSGGGGPYFHKLSDRMSMGATGSLFLGGHVTIEADIPVSYGTDWSTLHVDWKINGADSRRIEVVQTPVQYSPLFGDVQFRHRFIRGYEGNLNRRVETFYLYPENSLGGCKELCMEKDGNPFRVRLRGSRSGNNNSFSIEVFKVWLSK